MNVGPPHKNIEKKENEKVNKDFLRLNISKSERHRRSLKCEGWRRMINSMTLKSILKIEQNPLFAITLSENESEIKFFTIS